MKRLVIKTVVITVAAILVLMAAVYLTLALFFPKTLAACWKDVGNYSLSAKYYEKQYEKSADYGDLATLCVYLDAKNDGVRTAEYLKLFTENGGFSARCEAEDLNGGFKYTAYEYYYGKYAVAEFYARNIDAAVAVAKKAVGAAAGYTENNAFYVLLIEADGLTANDKNAIKAAVTEIKGGLTDSKQIGYADRDIGYADSLN